MEVSMEDNGVMRAKLVMKFYGTKAEFQEFMGLLTRYNQDALTNNIGGHGEGVCGGPEETMHIESVELEEE
jgi:hypothetical protein